MTELTTTQKSENAVEATHARPNLMPRCDVVETETAVHLIAEMPGVDEKGVAVRLADGVLTIAGSPRIADGTERGASPWTEFELGDYERRFQISDLIDPDGISASVANGLLRVELAKRAPRVRKIEVRVG